MLFDSPVAVALNYLLDAEPWARERLVPFAGETLELRLPLWPSARLAIGADGRLSLAEREAEPGAVLTLRAGAVEVTGNPRLVSELHTLVRYLRWDVEEDLSRVVGDAAAHRLVLTARGFIDWQADAGRRLLGSLGDYASEEKRWLVHRSQLEAFADQLAALSARLEAIDARVRRLE